MDESSEQGDCSALKGSRFQAAATCDAVDTEHIGAKRHRAAGSEPISCRECQQPLLTVTSRSSRNLSSKRWPTRTPSVNLKSSCHNQRYSSDPEETDFCNTLSPSIFIFHLPSPLIIRSNHNFIRSFVRRTSSLRTPYSYDPVSRVIHSFADIASFRFLVSPNVTHAVRYGVMNQHQPTRSCPHPSHPSPAPTASRRPVPA